MKIKIFLFDVDGVLLHPRGYRAATADTLRYFCRQMNLPDILPGESVIALYESLGITCEWDHVPLGLAAILNVAAQGRLLPALTLPAAMNWIAVQNGTAGAVDFTSLVERLPRYLIPGEALSDSLVNTFQSGRALDLFPFLPEALLVNLFSNTRDVLKSRTTSVFQAHVLGSEVFASVYNQTPPVIAPSYLDRLDRNLLTDETRRQLLDAQEAGQAHLAALTARYSLPPLLDVDSRLYSPEAEMALRLVGLEKIPVAGYGSVNYLAEQVGFTGERLLKPVPVQALAAAAAAYGNPLWDALQWGYQLVAGGEGYLDLPRLDGRGKQLPTPLPDQLELHVFEDSPIGILACIEAVRILKTHSIEVDLHAWAIAVHPAKVTALQALGALVLPDVNLAVGKALNH